MGVHYENMQQMKLLLQSQGFGAGYVQTPLTCISFRLYTDLGFSDGWQHCHGGDWCNGGPRHQLVQIEARVYARVDVYWHLHPLLHAAVRELHNEVRSPYGPTLHLEPLLICHSKEKRLCARPLLGEL